MPQAQALNRQLAYIAEVTFGTTPATPQTQLLDYVDFTFGLNAESIESRTLAAHGQLQDSRRGNTHAIGTLNFELNPTNADVFLEAGLGGTWSTNVLKVGKVQKFFSFEEGQMDLNQFRVMTGAMVNTIGFSLGQEYVTINCGLVGKALSQWTATSLDTTPTAAATGAKFFHDGGTFRIGGAIVGTMDVFDWTWDNGLTPSFAFGSTAVSGFVYAPIRMLKGKVGGQFDSVTELNKFITNADSSAQVTLAAGTDSLDVKVSSLNYTNIEYSNDSGALRWSADFTAKYNAADASTLVLTRV